MRQLVEFGLTTAASSLWRCTRRPVSMGSYQGPLSRLHPVSISPPYDAGFMTANTHWSRWGLWSFESLLAGSRACSGWPA